MTGPPLIEARALTKRYPGVTALDSVDFDLREGEVHVLFGENGAGKSTLISMLAGATRPSEGELKVRGQKVAFSDVADAQEKGIFTVFQEFSLIPTLSVAENIYLGREPRRGPFIDRRAMRRETKKLFAEMDFPLDPDAMVGTLSRAAQQMVEIAKAGHAELSVLILDEPTASLTEREVDHLFEHIADLKTQGVGIIYISHRVREFRRIADRVTVLRDGGKVGTVDMQDADEDKLVEMMTGRAVTEIYPDIDRRPGEVLLRAEGLVTPGIAPASFDIRAGEVLGLAGLVGCGKSRLMRAVMGIAERRAGRLYHRDRDVSGLPTHRMIERGVYYLSPDRKAEGLDLAKTATDNLSVNVVMGRGSTFLNWREIRSAATRIADRVEIAADYRPRLVSQLSGGNQQKVLFGKCFGQKAEVYILDEPTVGVDVGTRAALYRIARDLTEANNAVVVISSDLPEVLNLSHRLLVMASGRITAELDGDDITEERVLRHFFDREDQTA